MRIRLLSITLGLVLLAGTASAQPARGEQTVRADARLQELLSAGDARILTSEELERKGREPRRARIVVESPSRRAAVEATVDVATGQVLASRLLPPQELPFTQEQLQRATEIALRDATVRRLLGPSADRYRAQVQGTQAPFYTEGFVVSSNDPADPCARSRCIDLLFVADGRYLAGNRVTVQLDPARVSVQTQPAHRGDHR